MRTKKDGHKADCLKREFGAKLEAAIKENGIRKYVLAEKIGVTPPVVSAYTNGKAVPELVTLVSLCRVLNVSADHLLGLDSVAESMRTRHYRNLLMNVFHVLSATSEGIDKVVHVREAAQ